MSGSLSTPQKKTDGFKKNNPMEWPKWQEKKMEAGPPGSGMSI